MIKKPVIDFPTSPCNSPGPSVFDDELMAGIVDDPESDLIDIVML